MPTGEKYLSLTNFLKNMRKERVELSFAEIENILKFELPDSARNHEPWWSNSLSHSQAHSWINAGYKVVHLKDTIRNEKVVFIKGIH